MRLSAMLRRGAVPFVVLALLVAGCGDDDDGATDATDGTDSSVEVPDGIVVGAGVNDPDDVNIAVLQFLPAKVSVEVGTPVTWEWDGPEPHSVTFLPPGQELPPPGSDEALFAPTPPTGPYDGSTLVNSGLQPLGTAPTPFELTFSGAGTYPYYCVIHPTMVGEVEVAEAGGAVDTPADVAERAAQEQAAGLEEGRAAKAALVDAEPVRTENADGTTTWTVQMGITTEHTDVLAFAPTPAGVQAGDTVTFVNESGAPHTASFFGTGAEPIANPLDPRVGPPAPGPSPQTLSSAGFFNTGLLPPNAPPGAGPPLAARSFSFTVPDPGTYSYVCLLHAPSGMVGEITAT
jgi:plastocyanin